MKDFEYFDKHIATVPNFPKEGIQFKDITTTLEDAEAFQEAINTMISYLEKYDFDKIICADARGFLFGAPIAYALKKGLVIARKPNKLPRPGYKFSYHLEYGENVMFISEGSIKPGEKIAVVDDLLATGGSSNAMVQLAREAGGTVNVAVFYIGLPMLKGKEYMLEHNPDKMYVYTVIDFADVE